MIRTAALCAALAIGASACGAPVAPNPSATNTLIPTSSPTPLPTASAAPTLIVVVPSQTLPPGASPTSGPSSASADLDCKLHSQSIVDGTHFNPKDRFSVGWKVKNTGSADWDPGSVEFAFYAGSKMYQSPVSHLQETVGPGDTIALTADLIAPKSSGKYTTVWSLRQGDLSFCRVSLMIVVP